MKFLYWIVYIAVSMFVLSTLAIDNIQNEEINQLKKNQSNFAAALLELKGQDDYINDVVKQTKEK